MGNKNSSLVDKRNLVDVVTQAYENASGFHEKCNDGPIDKLSIDLSLELNPGDILVSHKSVIYGNWAHAGIFQSWNCNNEKIPDRISFIANHAVYPHTISSISYLRPVGEINSLSEKENITKLKDFRGNNYYDKYKALSNNIIIRSLSPKENDGIGLDNKTLNKIKYTVAELSKYFAVNKLKYGGLCKLGKKCSAMLPKSLSILLHKQLQTMENIRNAELICSSFAILTWQLVLLITGNVKILNAILPFNAEACLPGNIARLHKTLPDYWKAKTYVFGCQQCEPIIFN
jgi:hypothetical protein